MMANPRAKRNPRSKRAQKLTFSEHVQELRDRLLWCVAVLCLGTAIGWYFHTQITGLLLHPLNQPIFYTNPAGGFTFAVNVSLFCGFLVSLPIIVYQIIKFLEPALPKKVPGLFFITLSASTLMMIAGMAFAYFVSLPAALFFLQKFSTDGIQSLITVDEYFSFVLHYLFGFGVLFQLPLITLLINAYAPISLATLLRLERWVILISVIVAAILTPTADVINQLIMALPIVLLYQLTIVLVWATNRRADSPLDK